MARSSPLSPSRQSPSSSPANKNESTKSARAQFILDDPQIRFVAFKGGYLWSAPDTTGFETSTRDKFARYAYSLYPGISSSNINDLLDRMRTSAPDWTTLARYILFHDQMWDATTLEFVPNQINSVFASPIAPSQSTDDARAFLTQLADGDPNLAEDYLQAMAPLFMSRRPAGVIWFIGDGANGKSSLINALYRIIGKHFSSLTMSAIEDGRATPRLNGVLANVVRESSEGRVEDSERYKALGTHEPFEVRKFHTQETVQIDGDLHHIFNANNIPSFSDKTKGARRRTLVVPFPAHFKDDPTFEDRTFTPQFLGGLLRLILDTTHTIRDNGYQYKFSEATQRAKEDYDAEVNSVESFCSHLVDLKVQGFTNYHIFRLHYETFCSNQGLVPLGVSMMKRTVKSMCKVERNYSSKDGKRFTYYSLFGERPGLIWLDNGLGMSQPEHTDVSTSKEAIPGQQELSNNAW